MRFLRSHSQGVAKVLQHGRLDEEFAGDALREQVGTALGRNGSAHEDRPRVRRDTLDLRAQFDAAEAWHAKVDEDGIELLSVGPLDSSRGTSWVFIKHGGNFAAFAVQEFFEVLKNRGVASHQEDFHNNAPPYPPGRANPCPG